MLQEEETIYHIIPKEIYVAPKQVRHQSRFPPNIIPTGSTLGLRNSQKPFVRNCGGHFEEIIDDHPIICRYSTLGKPLGSYKQSPDRYLKKGEGSQSIFTLPKIQQPSLIRCAQSQEKIKTKPSVPKLSESPILLKGTKQNYVLNNIVTNILSQPSKSMPEPDWLKRKEYGQTPRYLEKIKERTFQESKVLKEIYQQHEEQEKKKLQYIKFIFEINQSKSPIFYITRKFQLSQEEIQELRNGLKSKWNEVYKDYQSLTHITKIDTMPKKRKKESCEAMLKQLETDMEKLNKNHVFVDATK